MKSARQLRRHLPFPLRFHYSMLYVYSKLLKFTSSGIYIIQSDLKSLTEKIALWWWLFLKKKSRFWIPIVNFIHWADLFLKPYFTEHQPVTCLINWCIHLLFPQEFLKIKLKVTGLFNREDLLNIQWLLYLPTQAKFVERIRQTNKFLQKIFFTIIGLFFINILYMH